MRLAGNRALQELICVCHSWWGKLSSVPWQGKTKARGHIMLGTLCPVIIQQLNPLLFRSHSGFSCPSLFLVVNSSSF